MSFRVWVLPAALLFTLPIASFAKCPISANGRLELQVPAGNLTVDTSGTDAVEVEVSNRQVVVKEDCSNKDVVVVTATMAATNGLPDWKIRVPRGVSLDLSTQGGSIQIGDTEGQETFLRTAGGKVTAGAIKGKALIRANEVRTGDIGGDLEVRGQGGRLHVGNVGGNAEFYSIGGDIVTGLVKGGVKADTGNGNGSITIRESNGDVLVSTTGGDITSNYVHGSFDGKTESGNIKLERVGSWVHAFTGLGDIVFKLVPGSLTADLHIKAETRNGNITMYIPEKINATIDSLIEHTSFNPNRIVSEFKKAPGNTINAVLGLVPGKAKETPKVGGPEQDHLVLGTGSNPMKLRVSSGTIHIYKGN